MAGSKVVRLSERSYNTLTELKSKWGLNSLDDVVNIFGSFSSAIGEDHIQKDEKMDGIGIDSELSKSIFVSLGGDEVTISTESFSPRRGLTPFGTVRHKEGDVYCPACESQVFSYAVNDSLPIRRDGFFADFEVECSECEQIRTEETLFAARGGANIPDGWSDNVVFFWLFRLITHNGHVRLFGEKIDRYGRIEEKAGREWLPAPSKWVGEELRDDLVVESHDYLVLVSRLLGAAEYLGDDLVVGSSTDKDGEDDCCNLEGSHVHVVVEEGSMDDIERFLDQFVSGWDEVSYQLENPMSVASELDNDDIVIDLSDLDSI